MDKKRRTPKLDEMDSNELKFAINALRDLIKESASSKQRKIFEDIQKTLEKAIEKERRLNAKCLRLQSEIAANTSKIKAAIQLSEEDKNTIDTLKEELEKAWNIADELRMERCKNMDSDRFSESDRHSHRDSMYGSTLSLQKTRQDMEDAKKKWTSEKKSLQNEIEIQRKASQNLKAEIKQLQQQIKNMDSILSKKNEEIKQLETNFKVIEEMNEDKELGKGDQAAIINEIEKSRLQIFELEEELTKKERVIEELMKENELKTAEVEQMEKEILETRNNRSLAENIDTEKNLSEIKQKKKVKNGCESKNHRNLEKQINELCIKENEMALKLKLLEFSLCEKTSLLSTIQNDNSMLKIAFHKEKELCNAFSEQCKTLKEEANKNMKTLEELEKVRNRHVSVIGKLEKENCKLEKELATVEHCKYPEKIKNLENNLATIKKELEERENRLKETNEEISKIRTETKEFSKHLTDTLNIIKSIHTSCDVFRETNFEFCDGKIFSLKNNIHWLILDLKEKIKDLVESYKEITMQKYKLADEVESLKSERHPRKEKESKWTETEDIYFDEEQSNNERAGTLSDDEMSDVNITVLETDLEFKEIDKEIEKSNEEAGFQEYEHYLSLIKPETISSDLEINSFHSASENKFLKENLCNLSVPPHEERKSSTGTVSLEMPIEENSDGNSKSRKAIDVHSIQKAIKRGASISDVATSHDLVKYRNQLRMKQKKMDIMRKELESSTSSFGTNSAIYQKDSGRRFTTAVSVKKLKFGKKEIK
ncbi:Cilia- and flagella-associated protein 58 like protein [Argiope bruennichi]|uniref:Cilia- and flagella-associated protein 58 like protein n=1 Tax=Argiope bruennichi TaxID=94029 RepID=A0A8T0ECP2_ARGBR|nr:Cilia- and flagella-associated protein 58 like protein [Argiope bruennichi]